MLEGNMDWLKHIPFLKRAGIPGTPYLFRSFVRHAFHIPDQGLGPTVFAQETPVFFLALQEVAEEGHAVGELRVSGPFFAGFPFGGLLPQRIVLQRLLYSLPNLLGGKTGIGTRELFAAFPHEGHGIKRLLHGFTSETSSSSNPSSALSLSFPVEARGKRGEK
jgi:hypothetical protein